MQGYLYINEALKCSTFIQNYNYDDDDGGSEDRAGPCLNIKTVLSTYGDFHVKDKTAVRKSYL